jgi:hypothetical protein
MPGEKKFGQRLAVVENQYVSVRSIDRAAKLTYLVNLPRFAPPDKRGKVCRSVKDRRAAHCGAFNEKGDKSAMVGYLARFLLTSRFVRP